MRNSKRSDPPVDKGSGVMRVGWYGGSAAILLAFSASVADAKQPRWLEVFRTRYGTKTLVDVANVRIANNGVLKIATVIEDASVDPTVNYRYSYSRVMLDCGMGLIEVQPQRVVLRSGRQSYGAAAWEALHPPSDAIERGVFQAVCPN